MAIEGRIKPGVAQLWLRYYGDHDLRRFAKAIEADVTPATRVLEIGAGSGAGDQDHFDLRGRVAQYIGIDPDPRVCANPHLDRGIIGRAPSICRSMTPALTSCFTRWSPSTYRTRPLRYERRRAC